MYCKDEHGNLLCLVECDAISAITWHKDGIYIYVERRYLMYDEVESIRVYHIKCNWTLVKYTNSSTMVNLQKQGIKIIICDNTVYDECPDSVFIGF
jgi:hypothetical protein